MKQHSKLLLVFPALLLLAACGNQPGHGTGLQAIRGAVLKKAAPSSAIPDATELKRTITEALANTDKRLAVAVVERHNTFTFLTEIARNGAYSTWGSPDRRTLSEQSGLVTASRGLGADLMSANVGESLALIQGRRAGSAIRSHIYLDGENQEVSLIFSCSFAPTGQQTISIGEIHVTTRTVEERCAGHGLSFQNNYRVSSTGRIVQSRQWIGPKIGHITIQKLR